MMSIRTLTRLFAPAALLALFALGFSVATADAKPKQPSKPQPNLCAIPGSAIGNPSLDWEFFLPGQGVLVNDSNGNSHYIVCGNDGNWILVYGPPSTGGAPNVPTTGVNAP